jgi:Circularly permutated YpsA SLOG family
VRRLVSGGQSGVDRAALEVAAELGIACGGWCPRDRWAEDGPIPARWRLRETPEADPAQRTAWNVRDSDGTLVLLRGEPRGGTALCLARALALGRPRLAVDPRDPGALARVRDWLERSQIGALHVAGPRESEEPGIGAQARAFLRCLLAPEPELPLGE